MKLVTTKTDKVVNNYFDNTTGELIDVDIEQKEQSIIVDDEPNFAMIYTKIIGLIDGLDNTSIKVLMWGILNCNYNTNIVSFTKPMCEMIGQEYNLKYGSIKNAISKLATKQVLIAMGSGMYRINPRYAWKGGSSERKKTMKYVLTIECPTC
jgi:hypothetical protein